MKAVGKYVGWVLAPTRRPGFCRVRASTHPTEPRLGKAAVGLLCLATIVLLASGASAAGADLRKAVRALLPATVAVEWRSVDSDSPRRTEVFPLKHAKAEAVAEAVKEVFCDLLGGADRSPAGKDQPQEGTDGRYSRRYHYKGDGAGRYSRTYTYIYTDKNGGLPKAPKAKGSLSIGVDATSNTLVVSAPASLFAEVKHVIEALDQAGEPDPKTFEKLLIERRTKASKAGEPWGALAPFYAYRKQPDAVVMASGTIVSSDGLIVTLPGGTEEGSYSVTLRDGRTLSAKLLVDDRRSGLRLLKIDGRDFPHVELADGEAELGQQVVAVYATDPKSRVVAGGIIAASGRALPSLPAAVLQSDLQVGAMSAGAPLGDVNGKLVGIVAAMQAKDPTQQGPAYAIPAACVASLLDAREGDQAVVVERGFLGVTIHGPSDGAERPQVGRVVPDSPAAQAGIQEGDQIVAVDRQPVSSPEEVVRLIGRHKPGDSAAIVIQRDDEEQTLEVTLGRHDRKPRPVAAAEPKIESVEPQVLSILGPDGKVQRLEIKVPKGGDFNTLFEQLKQAEPRLDIRSSPPLVVELPPATATLRVQRSDVEKKLDQLNSDVQSLQDHIQRLTEEVQKLLEGMDKE